MDRGPRRVVPIVAAALALLAPASGDALDRAGNRSRWRRVKLAR